MFTGIIEGLGTLSGIRDSGQGKRLTIDADYTLDQTKVGDSIAVNGACLTVVKVSVKRFEVDLSPETLEVSTFERAKPGNRLNLERAMRLSDRIDGHLVLGHVDGIGVIKQRKKVGNAVMVSIGVPEALSRYMIHKGSIAIDGISLTINSCEPKRITVSIIPYTAKKTTIGMKQKGDSVNIETDMIGKYVEKFLTKQNDSNAGTDVKASAVDMQFLAKTGFL